MSTETTRYAHEIVPHPGEGEAKPLEYLVRYHYAQAQAWHLAFGALVMSSKEYGPENDFALSQYLRHSHLAFLHDALAQGLPAQESVDWASRRCHSESAELVWERAGVYGIDADQVRPYKTSREASS